MTRAMTVTNAPSSAALPLGAPPRGRATDALDIFDEEGEYAAWSALGLDAADDEREDDGPDVAVVKE